MAGTGVSLVGSLLSHHTGGVNVGSIARHGSSFGSTNVHLLTVKAIANFNKKTETISRWCDVIIRAKAAKAALRGTQLAGAATPLPLVGALVNFATAAGKLGIKVGLLEMCYLAAIEIHWRLFQNQREGLPRFAHLFRAVHPPGSHGHRRFLQRSLIDS